MSGPDAVRAFAPGRANLIGEHTDYNGGLSLPFAIEQGVTVTAERVRGDRLHAVALDLGEEDDLPLDAIDGADGWRAFVRGVAAELQAEGHAIPPCRLEIAGDVPQGSGLSSSAAMSVSLCLALLALAGDEVPEDRRGLARLCSRVENDWVGANTGLLDQTASLMGRAGQALRIDFRLLDVRHVPLDLGGWSLVTVDSREPHSLSASGYNARREECERAAAALGVPWLAEADRASVERLDDDVLRRRALHVLDEDVRVDETIAALHAGDLEQVGRLLDASHASMRDQYDASTDRVEATVRALRDAGAAGARMVGGGFGGHVLALLRPDAAVPDDAIAVAPGDGARLL